MIGGCKLGAVTYRYARATSVGAFLCHDPPCPMRMSGLTPVARADDQSTPGTRSPFTSSSNRRSVTPSTSSAGFSDKMRIRHPFIEFYRCRSTVRRRHGILETVDLSALASNLATVGGVVGVVLGGSRARGTHRPDSDFDLGLYYRGPLDVAALQALADGVSDEPAEVTEPGGWGPWVDGGGWLTIGGRRVDWIYRDLDRVRRVWEDCRAGRYQVSFQVGHPLGFYSHAYAGELALSRLIEDPTTELAELRAQAKAYPPALGEALVRGLWEAEFAIRLARYGVAGADATYTAGCLFRAVGVACHALHGRAGRWLINEKGMVAASGALPLAPAGFAADAHALFAGPHGQVERAEALIAAVRTAVESTMD